MPAVLFIGSSGAAFDDRGAGVSVIDLMRGELSRLAPAAAWQLEAERLYFSPSMARRIAAHVEAHRPDVVVLFFSSINLVFDDTALRIRRRWSWLGHAPTRVADLLKRLAGGGLRGAAGPRGWLFRGPRWLARRLFAPAPQVELEDAVAYAEASIDTVVKADGPPLICRLATLHWERTALLPGSEARQLALNEAIAELCRARGVAAVDIAAALAREGRSPGLAADEVHLDTETRRVEAALLAEQIVAVLSGSPTGGR